jgi:hypothetical protein
MVVIVIGFVIVVVGVIVALRGVRLFALDPSSHLVRSIDPDYHHRS